MRGEADNLGKSVPVETRFLAPLTPDKPQIYPNGQYYMGQTEDYLYQNQNQGEFIATVSNSDVIGSSSRCDNGFAWEVASQAETASSSNSVPAQWPGMSFTDLLTFNIRLGCPDQISNGYLCDLDFMSSANHQNAENAHPSGGRSLFAPETPDPCKQFQYSASSFGDKQMSVIGDNMGIKETQLATDSAAVESYDPDKVGNPELDMNKTIEQKPRRRKHRPKVVRESKPKQTPNPKTPKPKTPKPTDANETPKPKRKYVRTSKTPNLPSATTPEIGVEAVDSEIPDPAVTSCGKALDFNLNEDQATENKLTDSNETPKPKKKKYVRKPKTTGPPSTTTPPESGAIALDSKIQDPAVQSCGKVLDLNVEEVQATEKKATDGTEKPKPKRKYVRKSNTNTPSTPSLESGSEEARLGSKIPRSAVKSCRKSLVFDLEGPVTYSLTDTTPPEDTRGLKRATSCTPSQPDYMYPGSGFLGHGMYFLEMLKKRRTEAANASKYYYYPILPSANSPASAVDIHQGNNTQITRWGDIHSLNLQQVSEECEKTSKPAARKRAKKDVKIKEAHPKVRKSRKKNSAAKLVTSSYNIVYNGYQHFSRNSKGRCLALPWINTNVSDVDDDIIEGMKQLSINRECSIVQYHEQNSLVPYRARKKQINALVVYQRDGVIVPFEGTPSSKKNSRAKVDIDDETNRVWNLLLENINNQGIDGTDEEKTKWWEEERTVFHGRVDSFIARMRLVQGDRRFSPWKGSVVDSVVGVFLTQNVSDHLSSSAYMSLAARYPPKSANEFSKDSDEEIGLSVRESEICIVELDDNNDSLALEDKTVVSSQECQFYGESSIKVLETPCTSVDDRATDDVTSSQHSVISSQNSVESPTVPISEIMTDNGQRSHDSSNPGSLLGSASFIELLKMAEKPMQHATSGQVEDAKYYDSSRKAFETEMDSFSHVLSKCSTVYELQPVEECHLHSVDEESGSINSTRLTIESATDLQLNKKASKDDDSASAFYVLEGEEMVFQSIRQPVKDKQDTVNPLTEGSVSPQVNINLPTVAAESTCASNSTLDDKVTSTPPFSDHNCSSGEVHNELKQDSAKKKTKNSPKKASFDWDSLRKQAQANGSRGGQRTANTMDSLDWEAIRCADVNDIAYTIRERGMNNRLAERIKDFLDRLVNDHGSIDLEWLRDVPPDKAKEYLLSIKGLGLKSVECVRLLTLHHLAFPVDTNVGRIAVRLGWVPLQPLPESLQLHLLELYPILESIQKYLWPRLCKLDQRTLYELHYHMITFGKVFCTKRQPNCNACPLRGECRHFASAFASARLCLPGPQDKSIVLSDQSNLKHLDNNPQLIMNTLLMPLPIAGPTLETNSDVRNCEPIVEIPASPEQEPEEIQTLECDDMEDAFSEDPNEIPTIKLNMEEFTQTLQAYMESNKELQAGEMSKALVALAAEAASIPIPKLKNVSRLRTEHHVYELPDTHFLLRGMDRREPDDPCPYLLAIWSPGETANSTELPEKRCNFEEPGQLCSDETCSYCNSQREANSQIVRGTLLIPCRTAMRGSFPLNGTYFQVNEVFADHDSSLNPIQVPTESLWNLTRRTVYFGTSVPTIFKGLSTESIQHCFWRGYVCVRGFDQTTRAPRPLMARLHISAYKSKQTAKEKSLGKD